MSTITIQSINYSGEVANILFNVIKINGKTMANTPANGGQIVDYGDHNQFQKNRTN